MKNQTYAVKLLLGSVILTAIAMALSLIAYYT